MKKHVPNIFTLGNLFCGAIGIVFVFQDNLIWGAMMIWAGAVLDFFDGFMARILNVKTLIGKELDSLADMVTFGLLPSFIIFYYLKLSTSNVYIPFLAFLIAIFSALRLAKFNVDERQTTSFLGLATPASAFFVSAIPFYYELPNFTSFVNVYILLAITVFLSYLMISEISLFSFKFSGIKWQQDKWKIIFALLSLVLFASFQALSFPLIILSYLIFSKLDNKKNEKPVE